MNVQAPCEECGQTTCDGRMWRTGEGFEYCTSETKVVNGKRYVHIPERMGKGYDEEVFPVAAVNVRVS